jgi:hypothetical protein
MLSERMDHNVKSIIVQEIRQTYKLNNLNLVIRT